MGIRKRIVSQLLTRRNFVFQTLLLVFEFTEIDDVGNTSDSV